jgi:hypothetical protein
MDNDKKARAAAASAGSDGAAASAQPANDPSTGSQASGGQASTSQSSGSKAAFTRRFPRFVIDVRLQVKMFQAGEFRTCWGRSTEMGQDGIGATLTGSLETGEIVTLEIPLPLAPYPIKVRAIVRYRQGLRYGFEFLTLNDGQRDTIKRVCQYLATKA